MRKIYSAILIFIWLFNLIGYRFVINYLQSKADHKLEVKFDNNHYDEAGLIQLKIPIHLPYQTSWADFERYDGEIEYQGILYKYVKRKVTNDTLVLLCIPNHDKMKLQKAGNEFFKNTNDIAQNNSSKKSGESKTIAVKKQAPEYDQHIFSLKINSFNNLPQAFALCATSALLSSPHISPEQPPDIISA